MRLMPTVGTAAALACLAYTATPLLAAQTETERVDKTVSMPSNGTLELKNFSGDVTITGTSGNDVVIHAVRRATRDRLDHIKLTVDTSGSTVRINANDRDSNWDDDKNVVETTFEIQVPASARLDVNAFSSDVTISGVTGAEDLHTFSGDINVRDARSAVTAEAFSGSLDIDASGAGTNPELKLKTFSGRIRARLADNARGTLNFDTFSGDFDSDFPVMLRSSHRRSIRADLPGGSGHTLSFHTFSGDVQIRK